MSLGSDTLIGRTFDTRYVIERKLGSGVRQAIRRSMPRSAGTPLR